MYIFLSRFYINEAFLKNWLHIKALFRTSSPTGFLGFHRKDGATRIIDTPKVIALITLIFRDFAVSELDNYGSA